MKAVSFDRHGETDVLTYTDLPDPEVTPNDVVVRVRAAAANYNDIWARRGLPGMRIILPHVSGSDAAGVVEAVGAAVGADQATGFNNVALKPGDAVMIHPGLSCRVCDACTRGEEFFCRQFRIWGFQTGPNDGGHAELVKVPAVNVIPKPANLSWEEAASLPLVLETVWRMLVSRARVQAGDFVLIWGAAGGLGVMAIQVCRLFGARPIAVAATDAKLELCHRLGAEFTINRTTQNVADEVRRITDRRGVDIVFEHVGEATWETSVAALKWGGTLVTCGATSGFYGRTDIRFLWNKQQNFLGSHLGSKAELLSALRFVERGAIKPVVATVLPLKDVAVGQRMMEQGEVSGKIVYVP
jgi:NADPH:quinone reductase-like Zn-dependent oxidoreductase